MTNVSVTSSNIIQACQNDFFPFPPKAEVVPQPEVAESFESALDFLASRLVHIALMMLSLQFLPLRKITQQGHYCLLSVS